MAARAFDSGVRVQEIERLVDAEASDGNPVLPVRALGGRAERPTADHVVAATRYRVDIAATVFLGHGLRTRLALSRGPPRLGPGCVSSVPCLYFTGGLRRRPRTGR